MDNFVTVTKRCVLSDASSKKTKHSFKYNPYPIPKSKERQTEAWRDKRKTEKILQPLREAGKIGNPKTLTKHLLNTLKDSSNPITHSTAGERAGHVDSCVTGHQRSDSRRPTIYLKSRSKKLEEQRKDKGFNPNGVLAGVKVYIGGYMAGTTDIEIKRIVTLHGGNILTTSAGATHIITSQGLSALKKHKYLHDSLRSHSKWVVTPQWIIDSVTGGKRRKESDYSVIKDNSQYTLQQFGMLPSCEKDAS